MRTTLLFLFSFFSFVNTYSQQEKIKGNKIVNTEEYTLETFHTIDIYNNFEISLDESSDHQIKIEADSNLHEFISYEVIDSVLTIKSDKDLRRAKALNLDISYGSTLKKIILNDKVSAKSLSPITSEKFDLEINDHAEAFFTAELGKINCTTYGKAKAELHVTAREVVYQINENSKLKGIVTTDSFKVDLYQKASATLEGEVTSMLVRADNETDFFGEKLSANRTSLIAEGSSDCYILANETITIEAIDEAEIFLLGEPKVQINLFSNEAALFKKNIDYTPSRLRLN